MDFNKLPLVTQLQLVFNDLSTCHVLGIDSFQYGSALKAFQQIIESLNKEIIDENNV